MLVGPREKDLQQPGCMGLTLYLRPCCVVALLTSRLCFDSLFVAVFSSWCRCLEMQWFIDTVLSDGNRWTACPNLSPQLNGGACSICASCWLAHSHLEASLQHWDFTLSSGTSWHILILKFTFCSIPLQKVIFGKPRKISSFQRTRLPAFQNADLFGILYLQVLDLAAHFCWWKVLFFSSVLPSGWRYSRLSSDSLGPILLNFKKLNVVGFFSYSIKCMRHIIISYPITKGCMGSL